MGTMMTTIRGGLSDVSKSLHPEVVDTHVTCCVSSDRFRLERRLVGIDTLGGKYARFVSIGGNVFNPRWRRFEGHAPGVRFSESNMSISPLATSNLDIAMVIVRMDSIHGTLNKFDIATCYITLFGTHLSSTSHSSLQRSEDKSFRLGSGCNEWFFGTRLPW